MFHEPKNTNGPASKTRRVRRWSLILLAIVMLGSAIVLYRPAVHLISTAWRDETVVKPIPTGFTDDASRMNLTQVAEVVQIEADQAAAERQLAALLKRARNEELRVSIAGTRHSMGGHTISPGGIVVDMLPFHELSLDDEHKILHAQGGACWKDIIPFLDRHGLAPAIMQSDNTFSVGGSLSVNCHGWQFGCPPIASTVEGFRLMKADGTIVRCSRTENEELFSLVLGGYGLFGIILDADLHVVPNERYRLEQFVVPVDEALATYDSKVRDKPDAVMVYARMSTIPDKFLDEVILNVLYRDPAQDGALPHLGEPEMVALRRALFRGSVESGYGKELRWEAETRLQPHLSRRHFSRNQLLNEGSDIFQNHSAASTDILHEYSIPPRNIEPFVVELRRIIPKHGGNLLNVTVRNIETDEDTFLRYADQRVFSLVMLFNHALTPEADVKMQALTRDLIDAALASGGRYYLPYRLHATREQFDRAYPQGQEFFRRKREHDPEELFQNKFYTTYREPGGR